MRERYLGEREVTKRLMRLKFRMLALIASYWFVTFWTLLYLNKKDVVAFWEIWLFSVYLFVVSVVVGVGAYKQLTDYKDIKRKQRFLKQEKGGDDS